MNSLSAPKQQLDPRVIDTAPVDLAPVAGDARDHQYLEVIGELSYELEAAQAEIAALKGRMTVDEVKAQMMRPYANRVFGFVTWYCLAVAVFLVLAGFGPVTGFVLSDTLLGIIAGSTAVSVIGLIGMVLAGLFGIKGPSKD